jgi:transcriptional regulator with XRE-family HTH domain
MKMSAEELIKALKDLNMSQGDLSRELGVRPETVYRWCKGRHPIPGAAARVVDGLLREKSLKEQVVAENPSSVITDEAMKILENAEPVGTDQGEKDA